MYSILRMCSFIIILSLFSCGKNSTEPNNDDPDPTGEKPKLKDVTTWMYQINGLDDGSSIDILAATDYPMLVLEPTDNIDGSEDFDTKGMLDKLRQNTDGSQRLLIAYIDIGEAEDYRTYWQSDWRPPVDNNPGNPDFIVTLDPDGWSGNYPVAYWDQRWKNIWLGTDGLIARWTRDGFDGVYLDWVEAWDDEFVQQRAEAAGIDPATAMLDFIEEIRSAGKSVKSDFIVIAQNAPYLLNEDPDYYAQVVDALAVEGTWFFGEGDALWPNPAGGDIQNPYTDEWRTANLLQQYNNFKQKGLPVFSVDYCLKQTNADFVYSEARKAGLIPLVTRVYLSRLTETPPD